ncbi:MAG TPA: chorismate mutase [Candidatus Thermoplasmatota archaeon]|jgi:chorismate mutase|nr:chorismate mutase [Candidatus Thermoplasmatota archaeon]
MARDLDALRKEIRATDRAILQLIAKRMKVAQRIGAAKRAQGLPTRNYDIEAQIIREARQLCRKYRIDQDLGEDLMRTLIRASVQAQENHRT